jgi:hypothetical protein
LGQVQTFDQRNHPWSGLSLALFPGFGRPVEGFCPLQLGIAGSSDAVFTSSLIVVASATFIMARAPPRDDSHSAGQRRRPRHP